MPTGAQRFISGTPGSLLYDVPRVQNAEVVFQPGAFDYDAIRNQQAGVVDQIEGGNMPSTTVTPSSVRTVTTPAAPVTTPVVKPPVTTPTTYTDARVAQALRESMAQGFSLPDSIAGAMRVYGVPSEQAYRAADVVALEKNNQGLLSTPQSASTGLLGASLTTPGFTDSQVAQAIIDSMGQGFTLDQAQQGAFANFGVNQDQFGRAVGMLPSMGYTIGQGFR